MLSCCRAARPRASRRTTFVARLWGAVVESGDGATRYLRTGRGAVISVDARRSLRSQAACGADGSLALALANYLANYLATTPSIPAWRRERLTHERLTHAPRVVSLRFTHNTGCRRVGGGTAAANAKAAAAAALHASAVESGQKMLAAADTHVAAGGGGAAATGDMAKGGTKTGSITRRRRLLAAGRALR